MNEITKDINITHLKRPALAVIKKPFLTNDEMTAELVRLLNHTAPASKPYVRVGGIFRAILSLLDDNGNILDSRYIGLQNQLYIRNKKELGSDIKGLYMSCPDPKDIKYTSVSYNNGYNTGWVKTNPTDSSPSCIISSKTDKLVKQVIESRASNASASEAIVYKEDRTINKKYNKYRLYLFLDVDQKTMEKNTYISYLGDLEHKETVPSDIFIQSPQQIKGNLNASGKKLIHKAGTRVEPKMPQEIRGYFTERSLTNYDYSAYVWEFTLKEDYTLLVLPREIINEILTERNNELQKYNKKIEDLNIEIKTLIDRSNLIYKAANILFNNTTPKSSNIELDFKSSVRSLMVKDFIGLNSYNLYYIGQITDEELKIAKSLYYYLYNGTSLKKYRADMYNSTITHIVNSKLPSENIPSISKRISTTMKFPDDMPFFADLAFTVMSPFIFTTASMAAPIVYMRDVDARRNELTKETQTKVVNLINAWNASATQEYIIQNPIASYLTQIVELLQQLEDIKLKRTAFLIDDVNYDVLPMLYNSTISVNYTTPSRVITKLPTESKNLKALDFKVKYYLLLYKKIKDKIEAKYQYFIDNKVAHIIPNENYEYIKDIWDNNKKIENKIQFCQVMENLLFNPWSGIYICTDNKNYNLLYNITPTKSMITPTTSSIYSQQYDNTVDTLLSKRNEDISSLSISRVANGPSEANITIKNLNNIYVIPDTENTRNKYYQYIGTSIIEEMDEVMLYLPDYYMKDTNSNNLELCFRGLVGSVEYQNDKGYNSISVRAKCPIKYLEMSKTNIKPSFSYGENKQFNNGIPYHPWTIPPAFLQNMSATLSWMMTQSLSCIFCQPESVKESDATKPVVSYQYVLNPNYNEEQKTATEKENKEHKVTKYIKRITFSEPLFTYLWYVNNAINDRADQNQINNAYMALLDEFVETEVYNTTTKKSDFKKGVHIIDKTDKTIDIHKSPNVYVYRYRHNVPYFSVEKSESNKWRVINSGDSDPFIVGRLTGTIQPVYSLSTSNIDARISDYKTNIDLIKEAVDKYNFAFYSDKSGIVTITPLNTSLLSLNTKRGTDSTIDYDKLFSLSTDLDTTEKYNPQVLTKEKVIRYTKSRDDSKVINFIQVNGQVPIAQSLNQNVGNLAIIKSQPLINKYGVRAQKTYPLLGANSASMCYAYGLAMLDRQNKLIESANIEALADAAIELNNPVYCTVDNTIYYLDGIRLSYTPGRTATMSLSCTYGRKPLLRISDYIDKDLNDKLYGADYEYKGQKLKTITEDREVEIGRRFTPIKSYTNVLDNTLNKVDAFYNDVDKILYKNMHTSTNTDGATRYNFEVYNVNNDKYKGYAYTLTEQSSLTSENTFYNNMYKILTDPKLCPKSVMDFCELMLTTVTKNTNDIPTTFYTKDNIIYNTKLVTALAEIYNKYKTRVIKSINEEPVTRTEAVEREVVENYTETKRVIFIPDIVQQAYNSDVSKHLDTFDKTKLETDIRKLLEEDKIQPMTWVQLNNSLNNYLSTDKALYATYADVAKSKCFLQLTIPHIAFNGYIYDYIPSILIEDLIFSHQALFRGANIGQMYLLLSEADKSITDSTQIINLNTIKTNSNNDITTNRVANNKVVNIISETGKTSHISEAIQPIPAEILAKFCIPFTAAYGGDDRNATSLFNAVYKAEQIQKDISSLDRFFYDKNN